MFTSNILILVASYAVALREVTITNIDHNNILKMLCFLKLVKRKTSCISFEKSQLYYFVIVTEKSLGSNCTNDLDCWEANSLCIHDKCFCFSNAAYNSTTSTCDMRK